MKTIALSEIKDQFSKLLRLGGVYAGEKAYRSES
jgi:hypothetical protein